MSEYPLRDPAARPLIWSGDTPRATGSPHLGLLFERFARLRGTDGERLRWLEDFLQFAGKPTPTCERRLEAVHRRLDVLLAARKGEKRTFATRDRLAIGLGNPNAAEIGFCFDAACGVPVLPGSSVKGIARAGAELAGASENDVNRSFGLAPKGRNEGIGGSVIFLDAIPEKWPQFEIDIINRHHDAEQLPLQKLPLDADKPNPVHFLTVKPGVSFVFRILRLQEAEGDLRSVWSWLATALDVLGAGAKTAVGYGRMRDVASRSAAGP